jgi:hypothetical protein
LTLSTERMRIVRGRIVAGTERRDNEPRYISKIHAFSTTVVLFDAFSTSLKKYISCYPFFLFSPSE